MRTLRRTSDITRPDSITLRERQSGLQRPPVANNNGLVAPALRCLLVDGGRHRVLDAARCANVFCDDVRDWAGRLVGYASEGGRPRGL